MPSNLFSRLQGFASSALAALALSAGFAGLAQAQNVLVVNEQRVYSESLVGQHIASELEKIRAEMTQEIQPTVAELQTEQEALRAETAPLSQEAIAERPDLQQRAEAYAEKRQQVALSQERFQQEMAATRNKAFVPVRQALDPIMQDVLRQRGGDVLLPAGVPIYASPDADITSAVIDRLNQRMETTPVNRVRLDGLVIDQQSGQRQWVTEEVAQQLQARQGQAPQQ